MPCLMPIQWAHAHGMLESGMSIRDVAHTSAVSDSAMLEISHCYIKTELIEDSTILYAFK